MNSEERKEYDRQRYLKNKEQINKRRVERYWENVEHYRQKSKEYQAKRIEKMIPQLGDTEVTFEGKMKALNNYLNQTIALAEDNDATFEDAMKIMDNSGATELITFDLGQDIKFKRVGDTIDLTAGGS